MWRLFWTIQTLLRALDFCLAKMFTSTWVFWLCLSSFSLSICTVFGYVFIIILIISLIIKITISSIAIGLKKTPIFPLIGTITKFSIVIGSPRVYLSRNRCAIAWVSNYRCPIWTFCNWIPIIGYPRDFHVNYARFIMASFAMFPTVFQTYEKRYGRFRSKEIPKRHFCHRYD